MTPVLQSAQLFLLAGVVFVVIGALVSSVVVLGIGGRVKRWEAHARHRALVLLAALPLLTASALMLSASLPALVSLVLPRFDHCRAHDDGHAHLCFVHLPTVGVNPSVALLLLFALGYAALRAAFATFRVVRALRVLNALANSGEARADLDAIVLDTSKPVCMAAGLLRPRILVSRGLLHSLSPAERTVVLSHERAHVQRRDALFAGLVRVLATLHLPGTASWLVSELHVAAEQACDEEAGKLVGDRLIVASAILTVARALQNESAPPISSIAVAFGKHAVERRVESLLREPELPRSLRGIVAWLGALAIVVLVAASELHHATESAISFIAH
jgi:beta-lactamase regulating signal transducer with metallopeptidase domain